MKTILNTIWNVLLTIGEYRYQQAKRKGFAGYY
jgi:hypothetical protein